MYTYCCRKKHKEQKEDCVQWTLFEKPARLLRWFWKAQWRYSKLKENNNDKGDTHCCCAIPTSTCLECL